jgi:hypothetical protein
MTSCCTAARSAVLPLLLGLVLTSCVVPIDEASVGEETSETEQSLVVSNWSATSQVSASTIWYAQVATLNGTTYMVHSGPGYGLRWRQLVGTSWTEPVMIPGQSASQRVSLAPFNGFLYMVRNDMNNSTRLWVSRFNPATAQWTTAFQIPHTSYLAPALAAFNGRLYIIGVNPSTKELWSSTMTTDEVFSPSSPMPGHYSNGRVSAAVYKCKLYIAHRAHNGNTLVYNSFDGTQWGWDQTIPVGPGGANAQAGEAAIAERSGYLHLLHRDVASGQVVPVWWTYFNGTSWASEITLPGTSTYYPPVLTHGGSGLVAVNTTYYDSLASSLQYHQPLPIIHQPGCFVVLPPITIQ